VTDHGKRKRQRKPARRAANRLSVRRLPGHQAFELVHPPCVAERAEDMEEVQAMLQAGEIDVAVDELRWLLDGCPALLEAHQLLGEIALAEGDLALARGHFGCAYQQALEAIPKSGLPGPLPYACHANRAFFQAGKGLAWCLHRLGESRLAAEVVDQLLALDPGDPLGVTHLLSKPDRE
jgi:tetratricopeptide (TPR) repeat protein